MTRKHIRELKLQTDKELKKLGITKENKDEWDTCPQCGFFYKFEWKIKNCPNCGTCLTCG